MARLSRHMFDRHVGQLGVTRSQWSMILAVSRQPGATQRMIAEALEISEASAGRLVDRLCAEGLLRRQERSDDRRAREVYLSDATMPMLDQLTAAAKSFEEELFADFAEDELVRFHEYVDRLYQNLTVLSAHTR